MYTRRLLYISIAILIFLGGARLRMARAALPQADPWQEETGSSLSSSNAVSATTWSYLPLVQRRGTSTCGEITTDVVWTAMNNPHRITCDVTVPAGITLTIEAGALVQFVHTYDDLIISGTLTSRGTEAAPISFQPVDMAAPCTWGRVAFMPGSSGVLDHAILEHGGSLDGMVYIASDAVQVLDSVVTSSYATGIWIHASSPVISNTNISGNAQNYYGGGIFNDSGSPVIQGSTFTGNYGALGGGLYNDSGNPSIVNNTFSGNTGSRGVGLYNLTGSPLIQNNVFEHNVTYGNGSGGGIYNEAGNPRIIANIFYWNQGSGLFNESGSPTVQNNTFIDNFDGGMINSSGSPIIQNNTFTHNHAYRGTGVFNDSGRPVILDNIFSSNAATLGGGLYNGSGSMIVQNNLFSDNWADFGGGIYNAAGNSIIQGNTFYHNSIRDIFNGGGGGMYNASGDPVILSNIFLNNPSHGLYIESGNPFIQNNLFANNWAYNGGGVYLNSGNPTIQNNTFYSNTANLGGALYMSQGNPFLRSNIIVNNTADFGGGIINVNGALPTLDYNDVWNNPGGDYYNVDPGPHDISIDPRLVDPNNHDFHLAPGSPCIDAGSPINYPASDFEGDPRPQGLAPDIGADEYMSKGGVFDEWLPVNGSPQQYLVY